MPNNDKACLIIKFNNFGKLVLQRHSSFVDQILKKVLDIAQATLYALVGHIRSKGLMLDTPAFDVLSVF